MQSEQIQNKVDKLFKHLDVDSRIRAINNLARKYTRRVSLGQDAENIKKQILEIKNTVPVEQITEYNKKFLELQQKTTDESFNFYRLVQVWQEARAIKYHKLYLLYVLYELVISMHIVKQVKEGKSDIMSIAPLILMAPFWFTSNPAMLKKIYKTTIKYPENLCYFLLTSELEDAEAGILTQDERDKIAKLEAEMELIPEDEEGDEKWCELYDKKVVLLPLTKAFTKDDNKWHELHEEEKELIKEFQRIAKLYDTSFAERIKDIEILSPDLVYELIEIVNSS